MKTKIIGILVVTLLIATALPIANSADKTIGNIEHFENINDKILFDKEYRDDSQHKIVTAFPVMNEISEPLNPIEASPKPTVMDNLPEYFNWRDYNGQDWTTPAKNQSLYCGSCWLFAAIGTLESIINIREDDADYDLDLSEQYVLSCLPSAGSCRGGWPNWAFNEMMGACFSGNYRNGSMPELCFPYQGIDAFGCDFYDCDNPPVLCSEKCEDWNENLIPIKDCGYWIPDGSIDDINTIKSQIIQHGPVCTYFYVTDNFMEWGYENHNSTDYYQYYYANGINHVVVIVGWKDDPSINKGGYWICKNSWDTDWGHEGFFNIEYGSLMIDRFQIDWVDYDANRGNWTPNKPSIYGPDEAELDEECSFSAVSLDPIQREISYKWDWGDGNFSEWLGPYESGVITSSSHSWNEKGKYYVRVKAKNSDGIESLWSNPIITFIPKKSGGTDQKQLRYDGGYRSWQNTKFAQSFVPSVNTLTGVSLYIQRVGNPYKLRISIRDDLENIDLTFIEFDADSISEQMRWQEFDLPDIILTPGETYYIIWKSFAFDMNNTFRWGFAKDNSYPEGCSWITYAGKWQELEISGYPDPDFCFKTYYAKSKSNVINVNPLFQQFLENHPYMFPLLRQLMGLQ